MSAQGATLQNYNNDLVKCIEDLREKREYIFYVFLQKDQNFVHSGSECWFFEETNRNFFENFIRELNKQILKEEEDKGKIQKELSILTDR